MNKYQNGKIYKIVDVGYTKCYVGSTCEKLSQRMARHRSAYEHFVKSGGKHTRSFGMFEEFGLDNCKIELIEAYPCENKEELFKREGHYIQQHENRVNKNLAGRTKEEYYDNEANKQRNLQQCRDYKENHKDEMKQSWKRYYNENKERLKEESATYRQEHRDEVSARQKQWRNSKGNEYFTKKHNEYVEKNKEWLKRPIVCECGSTFQFLRKATHKKSQKHQDWLKQQEQQEEQLEEEK